MARSPAKASSPEYLFITQSSSLLSFTSQKSQKLQFMKFFAILTLFTSLLFTGAFAFVNLNNSPPPNKTLSNGAKLEWTPCWFDIPLLKTVHCAQFHPADKQIPELRMPVVVIKSRPFFRQPSPILYLSGGPGYATGLDPQDMESWWEWVAQQDWHHDLVLFDQRGTGRSEPSLKCPELIAMVRETLSQALTQHELFALAKPRIKQCYTRLRDTGIELSNYTTTASSRDVRDLMELIGGSKKWNLYGISYGTRLALAVIRDHPEKLRSVILDSVYPPEIQELLELPFLYENAFKTLFTGCQADEDCQAAFPDLEESFFNWLTQFRKNPLKLTVTDWISVEDIEVGLTDQNLADVVFFALYDSNNIGKLPAALAAAQQEDYELLIPMIEEYVYISLDPQFSEGTYWSVECHDSDSRVPKEEFTARVAQFPRVKSLVKEAWDTWYCHLWDVGDAGEEFRTPVISDIPTLFLAGTYDPITPPQWTKKVSKRFSHGYFFEFPGVGHGAVDSDECASTIARRFLKNPYQRPHHKCLNELSGPEFVTP